jgi:SSS family transporter
MGLATIDWAVIIIYLIGMIGMSIYLARGQKTEKDYYLGGNETGAWPIAISTMATQCSTNSILGAPAFVAFSAGGGLLWLQYELALPLAMIAIMILLIPFFRKLKLISVYGYLEERFGLKTRIAMSVLFQILRALSTGVIVYGISLVISYCLDISFLMSVILLGVITIVYDSIGGMKAVIYSDVLQMIILYGCILMVVFYGLDFIGGTQAITDYFPKERANALDLHHNGFTDGKSFAFWPMLIGGFFMYVSYYGCDQTQVQRELSTRNIDDTNMSLFLNGILRFPLVLTYCFMGVVIGAYAVKSGDFISELPLTEGTNLPNYNMAVPIFVIRHFPTGMIGLFMVGLFAAAMSSLDSSINSISATTMEDIIKKLTKISSKQELWLSKAMTVFWGTICVIFSFFCG